MSGCKSSRISMPGNLSHPITLSVPLAYSVSMFCNPEYETRFGVTAVTAVPSPSTEAAETQVVEMEPENMDAWNEEPSNLTDLEAKYHVIASIPGRNPTTLLKIVKAVPKDGSAPENIEENQDYKLFLAPLSTIKLLRAVCNTLT